MLQAIVAGDYIMSVSSIMLARVGNNQVMEAFSQILEDLVAGTILLYMCLEFSCEDHLYNWFLLSILVNMYTRPPSLHISSVIVC